MINLVRTDALYCVTCPKDRASCTLGYELNIFPGFWRYHNLTDNIVPCENLKENCIGGRTNQLCKEGHIGGLCESCDIYGDVWNESWGMTDNYGCA